MKNWSVIVRHESDIPRIVDYLRVVINNGAHLVSIKQHRKKRSLAQNSLMWLWYDEISKNIFESQGDLYSSEDIHEFFKELFLPKRMIEFKNKALEIQTGTKDLNVMEMMDYLDRLDFYCAEKLDLILHKPEDLMIEAYGRV